MREGLRLTVVALSLLTRLPVPAVDVAEGDLRRASVVFPATGLVVAGLGIGVRAGVGALLGSVVGTVAAVLAMVAVTGALHEDGLADTADGLWGGSVPPQRLAIMRDSRIGTYGLIAVTGALALRAALLAPLDLGDFARASVCGHVLGRASALVLVRWLPPAADGMGARIAGPVGAGARLVAVATVAATLVLSVGRWLAVPLASGLTVLAWCAQLFRRRLGGLTGDTLGAAIVLVEVVAIAAVAALAARGLV